MMKVFVVFVLLAVVAAAVGLPRLDVDSIYISAQESPDQPLAGLPGFANNGDGNQGGGEQFGFGIDGGRGQGGPPGLQRPPPPRFLNGTWSGPGWQMGSERPPLPPPVPNNGDQNQGSRPMPGIAPPADSGSNQGGQSGFGGALPTGLRNNSGTGQDGGPGSPGALPSLFPNNGDSNQQRQRGFRRWPPPWREGNQGNQGNQSNQGNPGNQGNEEGGPEFRRRPPPGLQRGAASSEERTPGLVRRPPRGFASGADSSEEQRPGSERPRWPPRESGSASSEEEIPRFGRSRLALSERILEETGL
uniref:Uncharacterized protein n=1 Tax=Amblyomma americanum TaxID=6943 RepID=A0A0C9RY88_AMBAM